jgi:hypothetical protein
LHWRKQGLIFSPSGEFGWMNSHAQVPTVLPLADRLRIFFATRPKPGLTLPAFVDVDRHDPRRIIALNPEPLLPTGEPGTFDADGVMPSCVVRDGNDVLMYYSGWSRLGGAAPYNNATGLAISRDDGLTFSRVFAGPILDRAPEEPWSATSPAVVRTAKDNWRMWYSSGTGWVDIDGKLEHVYVLKSSVSRDGTHWARDGRPIVPTHGDHEAQTRPTLINIDSHWHMWFSFRGSIGFRSSGQTYRIGYATSRDLASWQRDDEQSGITVSDDGWDSQMLCYPDVVKVGERVMLFYNGNGFGESGFGFATLEPNG